MILRFFFALLVTASVGCGTTYGVYHRVGAGETLYSIGRSYDVSPDEIRLVNGMRDNTIFAGRELFIPGASQPRPVRPGTPAEQAADPSPPAVQPPPVVSDANPARPPRKQVEVARVHPEDLDKRSVRNQRAGEGAFLWPVDGGQVYSRYGKRDGLQHDGIDISAPEGTPVFAAADGRVIYSGDGVSGYGNLIIVKHEGVYATVYAHNRENKVQKGDFVSRGQIIATVGQTGRASGPHLHFEVRKNSKPIDPTNLVSR